MAMSQMQLSLFFIVVLLWLNLPSDNQIQSTEYSYITSARGDHFSVVGSFFRQK